MALSLSTGLRNKLLDTNALRTILALGFIRVYNGAVPLNADQALVGGTNTLLNQYSVNDTGVGLTLAAAAASAAISKNTDVWSGTAVANGTATFYRFVAPTDTGVLSTTEPRIQGLCALSAGELNLATLTVVSGTLYTLDTWSFGIPSF